MAAGITRGYDTLTKESSFIRCYNMCIICFERIATLVGYVVHTSNQTDIVFSTVCHKELVVHHFKDFTCYAAYNTFTKTLLEAFIMDIFPLFLSI